MAALPGRGCRPADRRQESRQRDSRSIAFRFRYDRTGPSFQPLLVRRTRTVGSEWDIRKHNRDAWDRNVERGSEWTIPVDADTIRRAREGDWQIILTPSKPVPAEWFPELNGAEVLCLASGGGQQGPVLAASGARVTVFDNSPKQLEQDRLVAERDSLSIETIEGDMTDLSGLADLPFRPHRPPGFQHLRARASSDLEVGRPCSQTGGLTSERFHEPCALHLR